LKENASCSISAASAKSTGGSGGTAGRDMRRTPLRLHAPREQHSQQR
jgi:hypothetical protein